MSGRAEPETHAIESKQSALSGSYGGIKVSAVTHAGSLDTLHVLFDESAGFSAVMKMFDYDPRAQIKERDFAKTGQWTLRAPMLALSSPDPALAFPVGTTLQPQLLVRNTTSKPIDTSLTFNWRADTTTGKSPASPLHLNPNETRRIDVAALQDGKTLPQNAQWASVTLATTGLPDEVVAVAASYDQALHFGAQTPFSDQLAAHWVGSQWEYDPQHDSIITIGNGGTKPTQAAFTILYNQGTQKYEMEQTLQPGEQMWMDIGKLIRENVPDKKGKTLPANLTSGSYEIRDLTNKGVGTLFEGKVIYDKTYGHVTYGCGSCCGYTGTKLWYDPLGVPLDFYSFQGVYGHDKCGGLWEDISDSFNGNWNTANHNIATVDYYGTHTGMSVGSTTSSTDGQFQGWLGFNNCPIVGSSPGGGANVTPTITSISPTQGLIGTTLNVTISGKGFGTSTKPLVNTVSGITATVQNWSDTSITASFAISPTSPVTGNSNVTVTNVAASTASNGVNFYIQVPTHLGRVGDPCTSSTGIGPLVTGTNITIITCAGQTVASNVCGGYQNLSYNLIDQQGNPIRNGTVTFTEAFTNISPSPDPLPFPPPGSASLNLATQALIDMYALYAPGPGCGSPNLSDSFDQPWTATVGSTVYNLTTIIHITRATNNQGLPSFTSTITTP